MNSLIILSTNILFLLVVLVFFILLSKRNGRSHESNSQIREDILRIREQIEG